ncbi:MAG: alanine racemase [Pseudomonadales bacterium]|nr:alanine racemase [Pseudomonadales bacterium]
MARGTNAVIDLGALQHNFQVIKSRVGHSKILAIVKADAYGHGIERVAAALGDSDGFGVAILEEAVRLRDAGITQPIVLLEGVTSSGHLAEAAEQGLDVVVHSQEQLSFVADVVLPKPIRVWLKFDTGMHRLGIDAADLQGIYQQLLLNDHVSSVVLMSHLACADNPDQAFSHSQLHRFQRSIVSASAANSQSTMVKSLANSAGIFSLPDAHYDWVRPGLALYGGSPLAGVTAADLGLRPVMELRSTVLATRNVKAGETVGYGATWRAQQDTSVAIVGIGYGDGYPRHISDGTPVLIRGVRCPMVGRVSMDMLAVDLRPLSGGDQENPGGQLAGPVEMGEPVIIWGNGLPVEEVAHAAGTINYELLCQVTGRVKRVYR